MIAHSFYHELSRCYSATTSIALALIRAIIVEGVLCAGIQRYRTAD
jgi:hypothetical protein